jgi:hypothetical protein
MARSIALRYYAPTCVPVGVGNPQYRSKLSEEMGLSVLALHLSCSGLFCLLPAQQAPCAVPGRQRHLRRHTRLVVTGGLVLPDGLCGHTQCSTPLKYYVMPCRTVLPTNLTFPTTTMPSYSSASSSSIYGSRTTSCQGVYQSGLAGSEI